MIDRCRQEAATSAPQLLQLHCRGGRGKAEERGRTRGDKGVERGGEKGEERGRKYEERGMKGGGMSLNCSEDVDSSKAE